MSEQVVPTFCPCCGAPGLVAYSDWTSDSNGELFDVGVHCHVCDWWGRIKDNALFNNRRPQDED